MLKTRFHKVFLTRAQEAVRILGRMPLSEVNRPALSASALRASVEALLAARFSLVRICHGIHVLASAASGPGIPEGPARLRSLRAALARAEELAGVPDGADGGTAEESSGLPGCPCSHVVPARGRLPLSAALLEEARESGRGLRILRFKPSGLLGAPQDLMARLADLNRRGLMYGLYAITGKRAGSPAREFALLVPDSIPSDSPAGSADEPLAGFPVAGRIRTLLAAGEGAAVDLAGFYLTEGEPIPPEERSEKTVKRREEAAGTGAVRESPPVAPKGAPPEGSAAVRTGRRRSGREGEYRTATVLRAELPGLLESLGKADPGEGVDFLNRLLTRMTRCVEAAGGIAGSYSGGALFAFWETPASSDGAAEYSEAASSAAAADSALAMRRIVRILSRGREDSGESSVFLVCALDAGPVLSGPIGPPGDLSRTVAGEPVRRAALIGSLTDGADADILVSGRVAKQIEDAFLMHPLDSAPPTKSAPEGVYVLLGRRGDPACPRDLRDLKELLRSS